MKYMLTSVFALGLLAAAGCQNKELIQCQQNSQELQEQLSSIQGELETEKKNSAEMLEYLMTEAAGSEKALKETRIELEKTRKSLTEARADQTALQKSQAALQQAQMGLDQAQAVLQETQARLKQAEETIVLLKAESAGLKEKLSKAQSALDATIEINNQLQKKIAELKNQPSS